MHFPFVSSRMEGTENSVAFDSRGDELDKRSDVIIISRIILWLRFSRVNWGPGNQAHQSHLLVLLLLKAVGFGDKLTQRSHKHGCCITL